MSKCEKAVALIFLTIIFAALLFFGGMRTYPDSESYWLMSPIREPLYPLFINTMSALFGKNGLIAIGIVQNGLAVISIYIVACCIGDRFKRKIVFYFTVICMLLPYVITPLFATSGLILTNAVLSEGVSVSMYNIYFLFLLKAIWGEQVGKNAGLSLLMSFLLTMLRSQFFVTLIAWLVVMVAINRKKNNWRKAIIALFLFGCVIGARFLCINSYNMLVNGEFTGTTYGPVTILANIIYVSERENGESIEDENIRSLFYDIYDMAEKDEMLQQNAPMDYSEEAVFFSDMHDHIKQLVIFPVLEEYVEQTENIENYMEKLIRIDELSEKMIKALVPACIAGLFSLYTRNVGIGLIRTVAYVHPILNILTLIGYIILICMGIYCYVKKRLSDSVQFLLLTGLLTLGNVFAVALTIMCLSRYMIYNMPYIYISGGLLLTNIIEEKKKEINIE